MRRWSPIEKVLTLIGLAAVDVWLLSNADKALYQSWEGWVFEQKLQGREASLRVFLTQKENEIRQWLAERRVGPEPSKPLDSTPTAPELPGDAKTEEPPRRAVLPEGAVVGRLLIPSLGVTAIVRQGVDDNTLRVALGHIPGTVLPGQSGNVGIAGHRDTLFRALRRIHQDDVIFIETLTGRYMYRVRSTTIVSPRQVSVLDSTSSPELTLVTCYPFYYVGAAPKRFIVKAQQENQEAVASIPR